MSNIRLEKLKVKNFKAFADIEVRDIPKYAVFVGANGVGKSTFFSIFEFLKEAMNGNVSIALAKLGGNKGIQEVRSRNKTGAIEIELKFREGGRSVSGGQNPLITYMLHVNDKNGKPYVERERLSYVRGNRGGKPWYFIDFRGGEGYAVENEMDKDSVKSEKDLTRTPQKLKSSDILAIKGLAQFEKFPAVRLLGDLIENWHISDFHISSARKEQDVGYVEHLSRDGDNLSLAIQYLYNNHKEIFDRIIESMKKRIPGVSEIEATTTDEGKVLLKIKDGSFEEPFLAKFVSDGTMKMLAYLVLLYDPNPFPLLCIEEPENQLYPSLLETLSEEFRAYSIRGNQVFVSTHSPDFLNATKINEVFFLIKRDGYTTIKTASSFEQAKIYMENGDKMGYLWTQGFFEGVNP
ncbi:MAG: AAA family ATPase [Rickettsiales bacterium]|jgi:predicted ATPase|nr:AAA family ATPase [Rickettsiales bacterium]